MGNASDTDYYQQSKYYVPLKEGGEGANGKYSVLTKLLGAEHCAQTLFRVFGLFDVTNVFTLGRL